MFILKTYLQEVQIVELLEKYSPNSDPNLTFTSCPNRKSKFTIKKIISQQPQEVNSQFVHYCTDR